MKTILSICFTFYVSICFAQYDYDISKAHPFGQPNPEAPAQIKDYELMIGVCKCTSTTRKPDGSWNPSEEIIWKWKYIMNGTAVQDETLKPDGSHSGSIRQFIKDSSKWYVHWFSAKTTTTTLAVWEGKKKGNNIILYKAQKAPNGADGYFRLTFYDMSKLGYKWIGEWVDTTETVVFPTWKIDCVR
jgi:hypothetical protein